MLTMSVYLEYEYEIFYVNMFYKDDLLCLLDENSKRKLKDKMLLKKYPKVKIKTSKSIRRKKMNYVLNEFSKSIIGKIQLFLPVRRKLKNFRSWLD